MPSKRMEERIKYEGLTVTGISTDENGTVLTLKDIKVQYGGYSTKVRITEPVNPVPATPAEVSTGEAETNILIDREKAAQYFDDCAKGGPYREWMTHAAVLIRRMPPVVTNNKNKEKL